MSFAPETVTFAGSGLTFVNFYSDAVSAAYHDAIIAAEHYLQARFTNAVTITLEFDLADLGLDALAHNQFSVITASYASLRSAMVAHATTADDQLAVAGLPVTDPSNGTPFMLPTGLARILGFPVLGAGVDVHVALNSQADWEFGQDAVGALIHEITEGGMGRIGSLGLQGYWAPLDLFRFTATGVRNYTGGSDGQDAYFGLDGTHVTSLRYHNAIDAFGHNDGSDLGDWEDTFGDSFGPGLPGVDGLVTASDLRVLDIIGWTPSTLGAYVAPPDDFADNIADSTHPIGAITAGGSIQGALQTAGDRDVFAVQLRAGFTYTITMTGVDGGGGSLADPYLRLHNASGAVVAQNDDISFAVWDSRLSFAAGSDGTYYIDAGSFGDSLAGTFQLSISVAQSPADDFASSLADTAHPMGTLAIGGTRTGNLEVAGDRDWLSVNLTAGVTYAIALNGANSGEGTLGDPYLRLHDAAGALVASNDDADYPDILNSFLIYSPTVTGAFYVEAGSAFDVGAGTYTAYLVAGGPAASAGDDALITTNGASTLQGGAGNDTVIGVGLGAGNYLRGDEGNDIVIGGRGFDDINGNMGNDTAYGGAGDDWVVGGKDADVLYGDSGGDIVYGNLGNDYCDGGTGNDLIRGGQGDDVLRGGDGADWLSGDRGNDTITGGLGADIFHTFSEAGVDRVTDFSYAAGDRVQVDPGTVYTLSQAGADTVIEMGGGNQMVLVGVQLSGLPAGWIFGA